MSRKLYFASKSQKKYSEMKEILSSGVLEVELYSMEIPELFTEDADELIRRKAREAFQKLRRPVVVEHTVLKIQAMNQLPGLGTGYFYPKFGCQDIVNYCASCGKFGAVAESYICVCDGKKCVIGRGCEEGRITEKIDGRIKGFDWDEIFIPVNNNPDGMTYAKMDELHIKNVRSMRKKAWDNLVQENAEWWTEFTGESGREDDLTELAEAIRERRVILFIGAGISASLHFPCWGELIQKLGQQNGYEDELFEKYGDNMMLAEYASIKEHDKVYELIEKTFAINDSVREELRNSRIYEALFKLDCPVIYTTNYDRLIEEYYDIKSHKYNSVVKIGDMCEADLNRKSTRIMKFHGDIGQRDSIILTESQYFKRMDFQSFMDVQLQADMLQYHVLFLGYSLSDINMKLLLYLSGKRQEGAKKLMKKYIFTATPNKIQREVFNNNGIITLSNECADKEKGTLEFLEKLVQLAYPDNNL